MRVNQVNKARKAQGECGSCGKKIKVGDPYKWIKKRYGAKQIRCDGCAFRPSDMTSSKMGPIYDHQQEADEAVARWSDEDTMDLRSTMEALANDVREVAAEYEESAENIRESFSESPTADECEEKAGELEGWADALEDAAQELDGGFDESTVEIDEDEIDENTTREELFEAARESALEDWQDEQRSTAEDVINDCPV